MRLPKVHVCNISFDLKRSELHLAIRKVFEKRGFVVKRVKIPGLSKVENDLKHRGYLFMTLESEEEVQRAIREVTGVDFSGRPLRVLLADPTKAQREAEDAEEFPSGVRTLEEGGVTSSSSTSEEESGDVLASSS